MREKHTFGKRSKYSKTEVTNIINKCIKDSIDNKSKYDNIFGLQIINKKEK